MLQKKIIKVTCRWIEY